MPPPGSHVSERFFGWICAGIIPFRTQVTRAVVYTARSRRACSLQLHSLNDRENSQPCNYIQLTQTGEGRVSGEGKWQYMHMGIRYACPLCSKIIHILVEISTFPVHKPFTQVNIHPSKVNYPTFFLGKRVL